MTGIGNNREAYTTDLEKLGKAMKLIHIESVQFNPPPMRMRARTHTHQCMYSNKAPKESNQLRIKKKFKN